MQYAIMRMNKLKGFSAPAKSLQHNFREIETPNANKERTKSNIHLAGDVDNAMGLLRERLNSLERKPRKDAVTCIEYMMTASPEWFTSASDAQKEGFFNGSREWLEEKYGAENIISFSIHQDETTPHISAHVVPITKDGRLCAKELIGAKKQMQEDQTTFAAKHEHIGLERGVLGSKAVHQDIKAYYAAVNRAKDEERNIKQRFDKAIPEKKILESHEAYKQRVAQNLNDEFRSLTEKASQTSNYAITEMKSKNIAITTQKENNTLKTQNKRLKDKNEEYTQTLKDLIHVVGGIDKAKSLLAELRQQRKAEEQKKTQERKEKYRSQSR